MNDPADRPPRFLTDPLTLITEVVTAAEPDLDRGLVARIVTDIAGRRPQQRRLAQALHEAPDLLTSGRPEGPRRIEWLIRALREQGAERVVLPECAVCGGDKPLTCTTPEGRRCCGSCGARRTTPLVTCRDCGRERPGAVRDRSGALICAPCAQVQSRTEHRPYLVKHLANLATGLDEQALVGAIDLALPLGHQRRVVCWELAENPALLSLNAAEGSLRLLALADALIAAGARGVAVPACLLCGQTGRRLRHTLGGHRCCRRCFDQDRHEPCARCGKRRLPAARTSAGQPLCEWCHRSDPVNHEQCTGCGTVTLIKHREGDERLCRNCWRGVPATCSICGQTRPCYFPNTASARCEPCTRRLRIKACSTCGQPKFVYARTAEGEPLCGACGRVPRTCHGCSQVKIIAARLPEGSFCDRCYRQHPASKRTCISCGVLEQLHHHGLCARCAARDQLHQWASQEDGAIPAAVAPVVQALGNTDPERLMAWLNRSSSAAVLQPLLRAGTPLSHDALDEHLPSRSVQFLRAVLVNAGVLEPRDENLAVLERWLPGELARIHDDAERRVVASFARWHHLNKLRNRSRRRHLSYSEQFYIRKQLRATIDLVAWLREQNLTLGACAQADLDRYLATGPGNRYLCKKFVDWATRRGHTQTLEIPTVDHRNAGVTTIPDDERWALLRRLLHDDQLDPVVRFSGLLVLLFAQSASRIVRLTTDQIITTKGKIQILLGRKPLDLPPPLDDLAQHLLERRRGHALLGHTDDHRWLIPGGAPGQPLTEGALLLRLRPLGILTRPARNTAMMDLAAQLPAAVLSHLLGLSDSAAAEWVQEAGAYRAAYAADIARRST